LSFAITPDRDPGLAEVGAPPEHNAGIWQQTPDGSAEEEPVDLVARTVYHTILAALVT